MIDYLTGLSVTSSTILVCSVFIGITWLGAIFIRPLFRVLIRSQPDLNSLLGNFVSMYGIFYGILMGLLAVASYQNNVDVERVINSEAMALFALFRSADVYSESEGRPFQESLRAYTQSVIEEEWPILRTGELVRGTRHRMDQIVALLTAIEPRTTQQEIIYAETVNKFNQFLEVRARRIYSAGVGIPGIMWYVVILGAFIGIFLVWMFNMSLIAQLFLGGLLAFFMGTMVSLIVALDRPLLGNSGIAPDAFRVLLEVMNTALGKPAG